jgi:uncharacterized integral membrane protein
MRFIYLLFLLIVLAAVVLFAVQNSEAVTLRYFDRSVSTTLSLLIAATYVLGMLSGWTVVGMLRRSFQRVTKRPST